MLPMELMGMESVKCVIKNGKWGQWLGLGFNLSGSPYPQLERGGSISPIRKGPLKKRGLGSVSKVAQKDTRRAPGVLALSLRVIPAAICTFCTQNCGSFLPNVLALYVLPLACLSTSEAGSFRAQLATSGSPRGASRRQFGLSKGQR